MKSVLERHSWWITIVLVAFMGVMSFIGSWQFTKVAEIPVIYETKEDNRSMRQGDADKLQHEIDRIYKRQDQLETKIDNVGRGVSEVKTLLIQMKNN